MRPARLSGEWTRRCCRGFVEAGVAIRTSGSGSARSTLAGVGRLVPGLLEDHSPVSIAGAFENPLAGHCPDCSAFRESPLRLAGPSPARNRLRPHPVGFSLSLNRKNCLP